MEKRFPLVKTEESLSASSIVRWRIHIMWIDKALPYGADILLSAYAVYLFFYYFDIFFARKKSKKLWVAGLTEFVLWQFGISTIISLPAYVNIAVTVIVTLFAVTITYEGMWKYSH